MLLRIAYDGAAYSGFVVQDNAHTVAAELEQALSTVDPAVSSIVCASRTDAGVHATDQVISFTTEKEVSCRGWVLALNQRLPDDIAVQSACYVPDDFEPRVDPIFKRYVYCVLSSAVRDPFWAKRAWHVREPLDLELMRSEARSLLGEHDFAAFRSARDPRTNTRREIRALAIRQSPEEPRLLRFTVEGNRFMHNMVRIVVGTLVDVGRGRRSPGTVERALNGGQRTDLGMTAPAEGLYLNHVELRTTTADAWPPTTRQIP